MRSDEMERCGARTRRDTACIRKALENGRCPNHGGLSTGPKTKAGRKAHRESTEATLEALAAS